MQPNIIDREKSRSVCFCILYFFVYQPNHRRHHQEKLHLSTLLGFSFSIHTYILCFYLYRFLSFHFRIFFLSFDHFLCVFSLRALFLLVCSAFIISLLLSTTNLVTVADGRLQCVKQKICRHGRARLPLTQKLLYNIILWIFDCFSFINICVCSFFFILMCLMIFTPLVVSLFLCAQFVSKLKVYSISIAVSSIYCDIYNRLVCNHPLLSCCPQTQPVT